MGLRQPSIDSKPRRATKSDLPMSMLPPKTRRFAMKLWWSWKRRQLSPSSSSLRHRRLPSLPSTNVSRRE
ncbi:unnamed protein product [Linum trigynum]|uniref:Uncharacterized protein n=1 Tax=Linum trigynum TaxID=586398 RepID=A0AAV2DZN6_9ROSI